MNETLTLRMGADGVIYDFSKSFGQVFASPSALASLYSYNLGITDNLGAQITEHGWKGVPPGLLEMAIVGAVGGPRGPITRGLVFVPENLGAPTNAAQQAALKYQSETIGAETDLNTGISKAPSLAYDNSNPNGSSYVKWDGYQRFPNGTLELIDAKTRLIPFSTDNGPVITASVRDGLVRKSLALSQNPGYVGVIELPTNSAASEAREVLIELGITKLSVRVRPLGQ